MILFFICLWFFSKEFILLKLSWWMFYIYKWYHRRFYTKTIFWLKIRFNFDKIKYRAAFICYNFCNNFSCRTVYKQTLIAYYIILVVRPRWRKYSCNSMLKFIPKVSNIVSKIYKLFILVKQNKLYYHWHIL